MRRPATCSRRRPNNHGQYVFNEKSHASQDPNVRNKNFEEVALGYTGEQALDEAQRCPELQEPALHERLPVMVHIPEFIAEVAKGNFERAAYRVISATSALPAVCGRVCPQESQCEKYCVRGKRASPWASAVWSGSWPTGTTLTARRTGKALSRTAIRWRSSAPARQA